MTDSRDLSRNASFLQKRGGSRIWGDTGEGRVPFARSSSMETDNDDLESLKWVALERLPTIERLNVAILEGNIVGVPQHDDDEREPVTPNRIELTDLRNLDPGQRARLVEFALKTNEQDNERLLRNIDGRLRAVGIEHPTVEVRFQNLCVNADVYAAGRSLPTLINFVRNFVEGILVSCKILPSNKRDFSILKDVSGVLRPGRMTLLLGPPGAGKTTLLLALAGKLGSDLRSSGETTYNGHSMNEFVPQRTSAYVCQNDNHIGELTVRETLDFAARVQGTGFKYAHIIEELARREKEQGIRPDPAIDAFMKAYAAKGNPHSLQTDYILKVLGLEMCADTVIGNEMLRGISGGQRKRVTTGEVVVGPRKTIFMDEISTGLDSSTTYQIVKCMQNFTHLLQATVFMALLQPAPEAFELFDDVLLLAEGHVVYLGPRERIVEFFETLGFKLPPRKGVADFLQEVTSVRDQQQYWAGDEPYEYVPVAQIADAFKEFEVGKNLTSCLSTPFDKRNSHPEVLEKKRYAVPRWELFKACTAREALLISRNRFLYIFSNCQVAFVALITGTLFLRTQFRASNLQDGSIILGSLFLALVQIMFNGFSELSIIVSRLPVFYKQRDNLFYPGWAFAIPNWLLRLPYSVAEATMWSVIVYYMIGLAPEPGRFFRYILLLFLMHQMALGLFRAIAAVGRSMVIANTFGSFCLVIVFVLGGFILSKPSIHPWWIWGYWLSPLSYGQNAIAVNEFLAPRWQAGNVGIELLSAHGIYTRGYWYWLGVAVLLGYVFFFNFLVILAVDFFGPLETAGQVVLPEEAIQEKEEASVVRRISKSRAGAEVLELNNNIDRAQSTGSDGRTGSARFRHGVEDGGVQAGARKRMILPFQPLALTFHNVSYFVDMPPEMKGDGVTEDRLQLLQNVSGTFRPGVLTALVGVSGAGKTTLMDVLAGRKTGGYIEGDMRVSGFPKNQDTFVRISGYVEQTDIHSPQVTVEESLLYSAWLRISDAPDKVTRETFVNEVMELVELHPLRNALVGLPGMTGLSTEQRKRLTIAVELVANPSIIFMDEPTSGLDARAAAIVMRTVRNTVNTGRTVVCTIHQPSIDIFEAFDELLLMKRGGQVIYGGPLGRNSTLLIEYFQSIEGVPHIQEGINPATWMLEVSNKAAESKIGRNFAEIYLQSDLFKRTEALITELSEPAPWTTDLKFPTKYSRDAFTQFVACLWKQQKTYWRSPLYNVARFFFTVICALIFGSVFWNLGSRRSNQQDVFNVMGAMYASVLFLGVNNASTVQPVVGVERSVYYRERAAGIYAPLPYAAAQGLIEVPYVLVQGIAYAVITYSMIQFEWTAAKFFWYFLFMFLTFLYFTLYGMMAVGLTPSQQMAAVVSSAFYCLWNLFAGFLIPQPRIAGWWIWYYYLSPVAWTLQGLIASQLGDVHAPIAATGYNSTVTVEQWLRDYYGFRHERLGYTALVLVGFVLLFWLVFAFSIKYLNFQKR